MKQFIVEVYWKGQFLDQSTIWATHLEDAIVKYRNLYCSRRPIPRDSEEYSFSAALPDHSQFETKA